MKRYIYIYIYSLTDYTCISDPACNFCAEQEIPIKMSMSQGEIQRVKDENIRLSSMLQEEIQRLKNENNKLNKEMCLIEWTCICQKQVLNNKIAKQRQEISVLRGDKGKNKSIADLKASFLMIHV